jgi:predicted NAD/FAD-binding protein
LLLYPDAILNTPLFQKTNTAAAMDVEEHFDCLVIGAGISGLDAAYHLQKHAR